MVTHIKVPLFVLKCLGRLAEQLLISLERTWEPAGLSFRYKFHQIRKACEGVDFKPQDLPIGQGM